MSWEWKHVATRLTSSLIGKGWIVSAIFNCHDKEYGLSLLRMTSVIVYGSLLHLRQALVL